MVAGGCKSWRLWPERGGRRRSFPPRAVFWSETRPPRPAHTQQSDKTLHVWALWRTPACGRVAQRSRKSLIAAYTDAIMSYNTILSCISGVGLPPSAPLQWNGPSHRSRGRPPRRVRGAPPPRGLEADPSSEYLPPELIPGSFSAPLVSVIKQPENSKGTRGPGPGGSEANARPPFLTYPPIAAVTPLPAR